MKPQMTYLIAHAAAADAADRSMRAAGRKAWSEDDYNAAVAEFERLFPLTAPGAIHDCTPSDRHLQPKRVGGYKRKPPRGAQAHRRA
jgi:hypothetical protein